MRSLSDRKRKESGRGVRGSERASERRFVCEREREELFSTSKITSSSFFPLSFSITPFKRPSLPPPQLHTDVTFIQKWSERHHDGDPPLLSFLRRVALLFLASLCSLGLSLGQQRRARRGRPGRRVARQLFALVAVIKPPRHRWRLLDDSGRSFFLFLLLLLMLWRGRRTRRGGRESFSLFYSFSLVFFSPAFSLPLPPLLLLRPPGGLVPRHQKVPGAALDPRLRRFERDPPRRRLFLFALGLRRRGRPGRDEGAPARGQSRSDRGEQGAAALGGGEVVDDLV